MGTVYYHRGVWNIKYVGPGGKEITEALGKKFAEELLRQRESGGFKDTKPKTPTLKEYSETFLNYLTETQKNRSVVRSRQCLRHFNELYGDKQICDLTSLIIEDYATRRRKEVKKNTVILELVTVQHLIRRALKEDFFKNWKGEPFQNPFSQLAKEIMKPEDNRRKRVLTVVEENRLLETSKQPLKDLIIVGLHTAMREDEICSLEWGFIAPDFTELTLPKWLTKGKEDRVIPLNRTMRLFLKEKKLGVGKSPFVFPSPKTKSHIKFPRRKWEQAVQSSGLSNVVFHDVRRTSGTRLVELGVPLHSVSKLLGHASIKTTERTYSHPDQSIRKGVEMLDKLESQEVQERDSTD